MSEIDNVIHQPTRLRIMASLVTLRSGEQLDFTWLRDLFELSDGNLGAHLRRLEDARYIEVEKTFIGRKPKTFISTTDRGRAAFKEHVNALQDMVKIAEQPREG